MAARAEKSTTMGTFHRFDMAWNQDELPAASPHKAPKAKAMSSAAAAS